MGISNPIAGGVKGLKLIFTGDNEGIPFLDSNKTKEIYKSWPSLYWILPNEAVYRNSVVLKSKNREYKISDLA